MSNTVVLVTGGFDPLHSGHIAYFNAARTLGNVLLVGINSDYWLTKKKGRPFMSFIERKTIVENLRAVDDVLTFNDRDGTANEAIAQALIMFPNSDIVFANGGDRTADNIPEQSKYADNSRVKFVFGVGGMVKQNSSSRLLENWAHPADK